MNILFAQFFGLLGKTLALILLITTIHILYVCNIYYFLGCIIVVIYGLPWLCLILIPLVPVYHWLQNHYRLTSRELKRISSTTLSPVYSHFNESLQGTFVV